jgi:methyl-accepting chemotaxis protein
MKEKGSATLRRKLVISFLLLALITGISGGAGILGLSWIQKNSAGALSDMNAYLGAFSRQTRQVMTVRSFISLIQTKKSAADIEALRSQMDQLTHDALKSGEAHPEALMRDVEKLLAHRSAYLRAQESLRTLGDKTQTVSDDINRLSIDIVDTAEFDSAMMIEGSMGANKEGCARLSSAIKSAIATVKSGLVVQGECSKLDTLVHKALLAETAASVRYAATEIASLISGVKSTISALPENDAAKAIDAELGRVAEAADALMNSKIAGLSSAMDQEKLKETMGALRKRWALHMEKITALSAGCVDDSEFDAANTIEAVQAEIKSNFKRTTEATQGAMALIKASLSISVTITEIGGKIKDALAARDLPTLNLIRSDLEMLFAKALTHLTKTSGDQATQSAPVLIGKLKTCVEQLIAGKKEMVAAENDFNSVSLVIADQLNQSDQKLIASSAQVTFQAEKTIHGVTQAINNWIFFLVLIVILAFLAALTIGMIISGKIVSPIQKAVSMLKDIAGGEGNLTARMSVKSADEIGELAKWFNIFIENIQTMVKSIVETARTLHLSSRELSDFTEQLKEIAGDLSRKSHAVSSASAAMTENIGSAATAMEQSSKGLNVAAASTEEITATLNDMARNTDSAFSTSQNAVIQSQNTTDKMNELGQAAQAISKVTDTIYDISDQTNLLALNATIEAARAGEAGKGFAVVAGEIKELARETANATEEINRLIAGIQGSTQKVVTEIAETSTLITTVNDTISIIATAMEEQSMVTGEIATSVTQAASGISEINKSVSSNSMIAGDISKEISEVNEAANRIAESIGQADANVKKISAMAGNLTGLTGKFVI